MEKPKIQICLGSSCFARGNALNLETTEKFLESHGLRDEVDLELEGCLCLGKCAEGPIVVIDGVLHKHVTGGVMLDLLHATFPQVVDDEEDRRLN